MTRPLPCAAVGLLLCGVVTAQSPVTVVTAFKGHTDPVYAVAVSPDGKLAATGSFDKSIKLWDVATGKEVRTLTGPGGHQSLVLSVAFSPAGDLLASGGADNFAKVWEVPARTPSRELVFGAGVTRVAASPDGKQLVAAGADGKLRVWSVADGKPVCEAVGHAGAVTGLGWLNAASLVSTGADRTLRYWNAATGQPIMAVGVGPAVANSLAVLPGNGGVITAGADGVLRTWPAQPVPAKKLPDQAAAVSALAVSADGNYALSGGADKSVRWVNLASGKVVHNMTANAAVECVAVMPNNSTFAAGTADGKLLLWGNDGKPKADLAAHAGAVRSVSFHPSQPLVVTAGADGAVKLWPLATLPPKPTKSEAAGNRVAFLPNGQVLVVGTNNSMKLWDGNLTKEARTLGTLPAPVKALTVSKDGALAAVAAGKVVKLWQTADGKELPFPALAFEPAALAFTPDRTKLVLGGEKAAWVHDVMTGNLLQFFPHPGAVTALAAHPAQPAVLVGGADKSVSLHTVAVVRTASDAELVRGPLISLPNTNSVLSAGPGPNLGVWNAGNGNKERTIEVGPAVSAVAASRNGQLLAVAAGAEPAVHIVTPNDGKVVGTFRVPARVNELAFHPNGQFLIGVLADRSAVAWNIQFAPGQPLPPGFGGTVQVFAHPAVPTSVAFLGDAGSLATGCEDGTVRFWKLASDQPAKSFPHPNLVDAVAFDKTGSLLATACHDGNVRVFDVAKGAQVKQIAAHDKPTPNPVYAVAWTPDGKQLVSASFDKSIKVWDAAAGTLVREIKPGADTPPSPGHRDQVFAVAVTKDGTLLASGSSDRQVKLWNLATGALVRDFPNPAMKPPTASHPGFVHALRFTPDGKQLVTAGTAPRGQGYLAVWSVADGKLVAGGEQAVGPIYCVDLLAAGPALLGCGPKVRNESASEAVLVRLPGK